MDQANIPSPEVIEAFRRNLSQLWEDSIRITGMPVDTLLTQVFKNAAARGLESSGHMVNFGGGPAFVPSDETMNKWLNDFFQRLQEEVAEATGKAATMPEA